MSSDNNYNVFIKNFKHTNNLKVPLDKTLNETFLNDQKDFPITFIKPMYKNNGANNTSFSEPTTGGIRKINKHIEDQRMNFIY